MRHVKPDFVYSLPMLGSVTTFGNTNDFSHVISIGTEMPNPFSAKLHGKIIVVELTVNCLHYDRIMVLLLVLVCSIEIVGTMTFRIFSQITLCVNQVYKFSFLSNLI